MLQYFQRYLVSQSEFLEKINDFELGFEVSDEEWRFSLPALYIFCCMQSPQFHSLSYTKFRQLLYQFPTNNLLKRHDGRISVGQDSKNINRVIYTLQKI